MREDDDVIYFGGFRPEWIESRVGTCGGFKWIKCGALGFVNVPEWDLSFVRIRFRRLGEIDTWRNLKACRDTSDCEMGFAVSFFVDNVFNLDLSSLS